MECYRRALRVSWRMHRTNDSVLQEIGTQRTLADTCKKRKLQYFGHVMRAQNLCSMYPHIRRTNRWNALQGKTTEVGRRRLGMDWETTRPMHAASTRPFSVSDYDVRIRSPRPSAMRMGRRQDKLLVQLPYQYCPFLFCFHFHFRLQ